MKYVNFLRSSIRFCSKWIDSILFSSVYFGRSPATVPDGSVIFFPCRACFFCCGLSGIVSFKPDKTDQPGEMPAKHLVDGIRNTLLAVEAGGYPACKKSAVSITEHYLGGDPTVLSLLRQAHSLKRIHAFYSIYAEPGLQQTLFDISERLFALIQSESGALGLDMGQPFSR